MATDLATSAPAAPAAPVRRAPGLLLCAAGAGVALLVNRLVPVVSPLLVAILLGALVVAVRPLPPAAGPGLAFAGRRLLRAGIVLLGLQLSLRDIVGLGLGTVVLVVAVVVTGIATGLLVGHWLGLSWTQRLLIACGFSICGAAAAAAVDGTIEADEEEVATAIALVVVFGTVMIGVVPVGVAVLGLDARTGGLWAGASIHEVAQVVAAGGVIGGGALSVAVLVKLARVLMLAPVLAWVGWRRRVQLAARPEAAATLPPLVPLFVGGFCAMVAAHTWLPIPGVLLDLAGSVETALLAAAMFALGCGVRIADLRRTGAGPMLLALAVTAWVALVGLGGAVLLSR